MDDEWSFFLGFGSCHDLRDRDDPRNPRLAGFKSVSDAAAVAMRRPEPTGPVTRIGFHVPRPIGSRPAR